MKKTRRKKYGQNDIQLNESYNIMRDLLFLMKK